MAAAARARNATAGAPSTTALGAIHAQVRAQLSALLEGLLHDPQRARVEEHIAQCGACGSELATLARTVHLLGTLPPRNAPSGVRQRLLAIPDTERRRAGSAGAVHRSLAEVSCPPHYWQIEPRPHGWEHWTCYRCRAEFDRPRRRPRLSAEPGESDHAP
jgi:hypothetical protein